MKGDGCFELWNMKKKSKLKTSKNFIEFRRRKKNSIKELILAVTLASHLRGSCLCGISPHLIKAIVNHYSNKRRKLSEVHVNTSNSSFCYSHTKLVKF